MKRVLQLLALVLFVLPGYAAAQQGTATMYSDVNNGNLATSWEGVEVSYENNKLTLNKLGDYTEPIVLDVNLREGTVLAEPGQKCRTNNAGVTYDYTSIPNPTEGIKGILLNTSDGCFLQMQPWYGAYDDNGSFIYTGDSYYNTRVYIPFKIDGLPSYDRQLSGKCTIIMNNQTRESTATYDPKTTQIVVEHFGSATMNALKMNIRGTGVDGWATVLAPKDQVAYTQQDGKGNEVKYYYSSYREQNADLSGYVKQRANFEQTALYISSSWFTIGNGVVTGSYPNVDMILDFVIPDIPVEVRGIIIKPIEDGNMAYNIGSAKGTYKTCDVEGEYNPTDNTLTFTNFANYPNPIVFNIETADGKLTSKTGQNAGLEGDYANNVFSGSASNPSVAITGTVAQNGSDCVIEIDPWYVRANNAMPGYTDAYFNTRIILADKVIPGIPEYQDPELREPLSVEGAWYFDVYTYDYNGNTPNGPTTQKYIATWSEDNSLYFEWDNLDYSSYRFPDFKGEYDQITKMITFKEGVAAAFNGRDFYQFPVVYHPQGDWWDFQELKAQFDEENEKIRFIGDNVGLAWYGTNSKELDELKLGPVVFKIGYRYGGNTPDKPKEKTLMIQNVEGEVVNSTTCEYEFNVISTNFGEDDELRALYTYFEGTIMPSNPTWNEADNHGDHYGFTLSGLKPNTTYSVRIYAEGLEDAAGVTSEIWKGTFTTGAAIDGVESIASDASEARYFNLQGLEVKNPVPGEFYILVKGANVYKIKF